MPILSLTIRIIIWTITEKVSGKGYVRKGEPDYDDDFKLDTGEGSFNSHVLTMSQKWKRIGNVHVDIGFLIEGKD